MLLHPSSIDFSRDQLELKQIKNSESTAQFLGTLRFELYTENILKVLCGKRIIFIGRKYLMMELSIYNLYNILNI